MLKVKDQSISELQKLADQTRYSFDRGTTAIVTTSSALLTVVVVALVV